jgi:hypothetical protein
MDVSKFPNNQFIQNQPDRLTKRLDELRVLIQRKDPTLLARNTGAEYKRGVGEKGCFVLPLWNREVRVSFPDFTAHDSCSNRVLSSFETTLLAYYFSLSDGTREAGKWIAFSELPDGKFYTQAFQGYTGNVLAKTYKEDQSPLQYACEEIGGQLLAIGDIGYSFRVLPHILIALVCWTGDDEFPSSYKILFDASISHHLTTDVCAILGSTLTKKILNVKSIDPEIKDSSIGSSER